LDSISAGILKGLDEAKKVIATGIFNILNANGYIMGSGELLNNVWNQWVNAGYVGDVEATINSLKTLVAQRYAYYTQTALPTLNAELKALMETKDALNAELAVPKTQLAAKKAELEEVIKNQEIGGVTAPDLDINVEYGEHIGTPEHDCTVGNASV
jgi:hypothetical protein